MKQNNLIKRVFIAIAMMLTVSVAASAHDFEVDGIYYNITSSSDKTCAVTFQGSRYWEYSNEYTGEIVIPESVTFESTTYSVTSIGERAFCDCSGLTSVTIPNSVTSIGDGAFYYCSGLTSITIPNSVTSIGSDVFRSCSGLTSVTIPESVTSIGNHAFYCCSSLTSITIPNSVTSIGVSAFASCSGLTSVTIPESITSIGSSAFHNCYRLTSITIPNSITSIGDNAFMKCKKLTSITIPNSVTSIGEYAFSDCSSLTSVTIPNSVTSIGAYAFQSCSGLTGTLELPNSIESIGGSAFYLTNYKICNSQAQTPPTLGSDAMPSYLSLVLVPAGSVDAYKADEQWNKYTIIFEGACDIEVTNETGGELSKAILTQTRKNLNNITGLTVHGTLNADDLEKINSNMTSLLHLDISDTDVTEIPANAFKDKKTLLSVKLPNGLKSIGEYAFSGAYLSDELVLPETLETIGEYAFQNCSSLEAIDMSGAAELTTLNKAVFSDCISLKSLKLSDSIKIIGDNTFYGCTSLDNVTFPSSLQSIGYSAFYNCSGIKSLDFDGCDNLVSIEDCAFKFCTGIKSLCFDGCVNLVSIGDYAFTDCSGIETLSFTKCKSLTSFGNYAFSGISAKEIDMSGCSSMTITSSHMFYGCESLQTIKLPKSVISISSYAFGYCTSLEVVNLEGCENLSNIDSKAFYGCSGLKLIDLKDCTSLTTINENTFSTCSALETVNFPSTLASIGTNAFANCTNLLHMSVPCTTPPAIANGADPFAGVDNVACILSIPTESFFDYWDANYWGGFVDVENKSDIQIKVSNSEDDKSSIIGGCLINYQKHHFDNSSHRALSLNNIRASLTEEAIEKVDDKNKALTAGGQSVFVGNGDAVTFYFTPEDGKEIDKVLFNGEDVTSELVNNTYTTSAVTEMSSLQVILRQGTLTEIEETLVCEEGEAEYYNLQGVKVVNPSSGLYIKKQGNKVTKVIL